MTTKSEHDAEKSPHDRDARRARTQVPQRALDKDWHPPDFAATINELKHLVRIALETVAKRDRDLRDVLSRATAEELDVIADIITDSGKGRLALNSSVKDKILAQQKAKALNQIVELLEEEIRSFGGNSARNLVRSEKVSYRQLASDVLKKLGGKPSEAQDIFSLEQAIIEEAVRQGSPRSEVILEKRGQVLRYELERIARKLAGLPMKNRVSKGLTFGAVATPAGLGAALSLAARFAPLPTSLPTLAATTAIHAAGPAFRVTIPITIQIANIRLRQVDDEFTSYKEALRACI